MPVHDAEATLRETLASLEKQSFRDWQLVAVLDRCTDGSEDILEDFRAQTGNNVRIMNVHAHGPSAARNRGLECADTTYICLLDADDVWYPTKLQCQIDLLESQPDLLGCIVGYDFIDASGDPYPAALRFTWSQDSLLRWATLRGPGPGLCSTVMYRADDAGDLRFDESLLNVEDVAFALEMDARGPMATINAPLVAYRLSDNQNHRNTSTMEQAHSALFHGPVFDNHATWRRQGLINLNLFLAWRRWKGKKRASAALTVVRLTLANPCVASQTLIYRTRLAVRQRLLRKIRL